jgi:hypothetical protein
MIDCSAIRCSVSTNEMFYCQAFFIFKYIIIPLIIMTIFIYFYQRYRTGKNLWRKR